MRSYSPPQKAQETFGFWEALGKATHHSTRVIQKQKAAWSHATMSKTPYKTCNLPQK